MPDKAKPPVSILAVDDDPTSRMLVRATLESHLGTVVEAENGLVGVQALESRPFDLAIVDLDMPVMDGFGVIEHARAREETRHLPIIVVTGRDDVVAIERAFALGATSFLCKPINWNVFRHQVSYVLNMAQIERDARAAQERADRIASVRGRLLAAIESEIGKTVGVLVSDAADAEAREAGARLNALVSRVKRASDVLTSDGSVAIGNFKADEIVTEAIALVRASLGPAAERIRARGGGRTVACDRMLAAEALAEVLKNALCFSPPGLDVFLSVAEGAERVRFEVADRGPGIPEHLLERGIEALAPALARRDGAGLGVGLAMARAVAEAHGGHLGIISEPGQGTEVFLSFAAPADRAQSQRNANEAARISPTRLAKAAGGSDS
jgi:CheY-like chemotaxis protein